MSDLSVWHHTAKKQKEEFRIFECVTVVTDHIKFTTRITFCLSKHFKETYTEFAKATGPKVAFTQEVLYDMSKEALLAQIKYLVMNNWYTRCGQHPFYEEGRAELTEALNKLAMFDVASEEYLTLCLSSEVDMFTEKFAVTGVPATNANKKAEQLPGARSLVGYPCGCGAQDFPMRDLLMLIVIHLNDQHSWTREKIADWMDELHDKGEINIEFQPWQDDTDSGMVEPKDFTGLGPSGTTPQPFIHIAKDSNHKIPVDWKEMGYTIEGINLDDSESEPFTDEQIATLKGAKISFKALDELKGDSNEQD